MKNTIIWFIRFTFMHILDTSLILNITLYYLKENNYFFFISCLIDNFFFIKLIINFFKALNKKSNRQKIIKKYTYFDSGYRPWWNQETQAWGCQVHSSSPGCSGPRGNSLHPRDYSCPRPGTLHLAYLYKSERCINLLYVNWL